MNSDLYWPEKLHGLIRTINASDILEIILVAVIIYKLYRMIEGTRAVTLVKGIFVLFMVSLFCNIMHLHLLSWIFEKVMTWSFVVLPIVFQPELRRTLERLGEGRFLFEDRATLDEEEATKVVREIVVAAKELSRTKTGALLVIEREMGLNDISDTGIKIDGLITTEFLLNVFIVNTPLHDGAAIIRGKRLISAGCLLPLTERRGLPKELGTRHRAAIGISEQCDALVLIVSEETGTISIADNGRLTRRFDEETLAAALRPAFIKSPQKGIRGLFSKWKTAKE
ncbi:MAG: diadenylate cyclase CdaA [Selenomonadaceae bacterium]|nr:diadenylate cyclase CdaA [Selenomonadaceae bacterium]